MRASVLTETGSVSVEERDRPEPGPDDVVVEVGACGVCKTDYHMYHGAFDVDLPQVVGHEAAGTVAAVGDDVERVDVGARVAINPTVNCGSCSYCKAGRETLCEDLTSIGGAADHVLDGAFAEYVRVPAGNVEAIGDLSFREAALAEPLACCVHGVDRADLEHGDAVVVIGAGPIGLLLVQTLRDAGAGDILVSEPADERRELALTVGADYVVDPTEDDLEAEVEERVGTVDLAVEVVGLEATVQQALDLTSAGGRTLVFGVPPEDATVEVNPFDYFYDELELTGTFALRPADFETAVGMLRQERIDAEAMISGEYGLEDLPGVFERMDDAEGLKKLIRPGA